MDRAKVKALLASGVLQAYAEGRDIQLLNVSGCWEDMEPDDFLLFSLNDDHYRVKPETLHDWVVESGDYVKIFYAKTETEIKQISGWYDRASYRQLVPVTEEE